MTSSMSLLDALRAAAAIPEVKSVYVDVVPTLFQRPCVLIQPVTEETQPGNSALVWKTAYYTLTIFDGSDDYQDNDGMALLALRQKILEQFGSGYLNVDGRALPVRASTGGRNHDKAFIDLQMEYYDLRDEAPDKAPKMETVKMNINQTKG